MKFKIRYMLLPLLIISALFIGITAVNSNPKNLECNMISVTTLSKEGKRAIAVVFDYKWSKTPIRLSPDTLEISLPAGWRLDDFSVDINGENATDRFYTDLIERRDTLVLHFNSNENFFSEESFRGKIVLVPENTTKIDNDFHSSASMKYLHKSFLSTVSQGSAVSWVNRTVLSENN